MTAAIVAIAPYRNDLADIPKGLRRLADDLETDIAAYGDGCVCRCVVVVRFSLKEPGVYAFGTMEGLSQAYMDLHAGAQELMAMQHPERPA